MSMTNEEAIERLERLKRSCRDLAASMPDKPGWTLHGMALDMALTALRPVSREQVEKVWRGCINCHDKEELAKHIHCWPSFCPVCGRPLTDEAVEMVMERLEALYGKAD